MCAKVYMLGAQVLRVEGARSPVVRIPDLLDAAGISEVVVPGDPVAIKMHLGSDGGSRTIRPEFVRKVVDKVKLLGGRPFIAETCRPDAIQYLEIANQRGYNDSTLGCPVVIVDGFKGNDFRDVPTGGQIVKTVQVAAGIFHAPSMIVLSHVTGHGDSSYAGAIKNIGMGCVARSSKGKIHRSVNVDPPIFHPDRCAACGECAKACNYGALTLVQQKPVINPVLCERCMRCTRACTHAALVRPAPTRENFMQALAESVKGVLSTFEPSRVLFVNFVVDVTPQCDCAPSLDIPIVPDQGILCSRDLVSLEQASLDLVRRAPAMPGSIAHDRGLGPGMEKFGALHGLDPQFQIDAAQRLGLGSRDYELVLI